MIRWNYLEDGRESMSSLVSATSVIRRLINKLTLVFIGITKKATGCYMTPVDKIEDGSWQARRGGA